MVEIEKLTHNEIKVLNVEKEDYETTILESAASPRGLKNLMKEVEETMEWQRKKKKSRKKK